LTPIFTHVHPVLVTGSCNLYKQMSSSLCTCYSLYHYISCVPTSDNGTHIHTHV